jgi:hypothetical protein
MNGTKKFLFSLATLDAMPGFADTNGPIISSGESGLEALFKADLQYRSESESDAVVGTEGREGVYIGSGDGTVAGDRLHGAIRWSLWSGNCLYPVVRSGRSVPEGSSPLHNQSFRVYRDTGWSPNSV